MVLDVGPGDQGVRGHGSCKGCEGHGARIEPLNP